MTLSARIEAVITGVINREKGFVDHPSDRGGPTKDGITEARARAEGYYGDMRYLPDDIIRRIYLQRYVLEPWFDRVYELHAATGEELVDTGVLMGQGVAATFFQRWLNGFNSRGTHYPDIVADGRIGNMTLGAFRSYLARRGAEGGAVMVAALNALQGEKLLAIAEYNVTQEDFLYGWMRARVYLPAGS